MKNRNISRHDADEILKMIERKYDECKLSKKTKQHFLAIVQTGLLSSGISEDVCHKCVGSGYATKEV